MSSPIESASGFGHVDRRPKTFDVRVRGCKVNQCEAAAVARALESRGLRQARTGERPDVVVVHGCAVTAAAERESTRLARAARREGAVHVVFSGCAAAIPAAAEGVEIIPSGPGWSDAIARWIDLLPAPRPGGDCNEAFPGHHRAFVKIQDGCDRWCTYCIVPALRGPPRDTSLDDILREAAARIRAGHLELVLSGVNIGRWRASLGGLAAVVREVARLPGLRRLRLSSLHPADLTPELLDVMRSSAAVVPHVHLPLQSGSDDVLRRMNRGYTAGEFLAAVERARAYLDRAAITTDVMVGFPGETGRDFNATVAVCRAAGVSRIHIFPFSPRPSTAAARLDGRVPQAVVRERCGRLRRLAMELSVAAHSGHVGEEVGVLCETWDGATAAGYSERYMPVRFPAPADPRGRIWRVRVVAADADTLTGELIGPG